MLHQKKFDPNARYVAAKARILVNGHDLKQGDVVPDGIPSRKLQQLFESRLIDIKPTEITPPTVQATEDSQIKKTVAVRRTPAQKEKDHGTKPEIQT